MGVNQSREYAQELRERLMMIMREKTLSRSGLARAVDFQPTNMSQIFKGKRDVPDSLVRKVIETFPDINPMWLVHGQGNMHLNGTALAAAELDTRPRLPVAAAAGQLSDYLDGYMKSDCEELPVIRRFPEYDFTMFIKGNSMSPRYESGDEIALRKVQDVVQWGKDYVVACEDGAVFKKIYDQGDSIRCVSYNHEEYPDFLIPKDKIYGIYRLVGMIRA